MATEEIEISQLELADEILADMVTPVETATETKAITLSQLRKWLGSSLPTGCILPVVGRIEDSRFTLLDGKTLSRTGTYEEFCNKVIEQVNAGNWFSCTQSQYDEDLSKYGQCGRFVIETDYVRIPTITRYIGATITLSEIGKTYAESLPNVKFDFKNVLLTSGALVSTGVKITQINYIASGNQSTGAMGMNGIDASLLSSTYQDGAKVNPEHTKYPYYMVISTTGQTAEVGIDINKVYEDVNLKANTDASNFTATGKTTVVGWGMPDYSARIDVPWNTEVTRNYPCFVNIFPNFTVRGNDVKITINNVNISIYSEGGEQGSGGSGQFFIPANTPYKVSGGYSNSGTIYEFPLKGVN